MGNRDISVIIVNWNVRELVLRLIASIKQHTRGVSYEILVMDNASSDGSVEAIREQHPDITLIANTQNLGFAKAVNQGLALAQGRVILVQNPDSELLDDALSAFVAAFDMHPEYGIIGPKLLNTDGTVQDSIRRFPGSIDQTMIALKLHHPFRGAAPIKRYLADDFDYTREQDVDQLMGASFAFRRDLMEKIGMLDERFFIWYEEVDFMKRAKDAGYSVRYLPNIALTHHRGQSFGQVFSVQKQKYFSTSMAQYMGKHFGALVGAWFWVLRPISLGLAWLQNAILRNPVTMQALGFLCALEVASFVMQWYPVFALPFLVLFGLGVFGMSVARGMGFGLSALALELLVGSHGHLITLGMKGSGGIGIRIVLFAAVMAAWAVSMARKGVGSDGERLQHVWKLLRDLPKRVWLLLGAVVYGCVVAIFGGRGISELFADANGYLYFLLIFPIVSYVGGLPNRATIGTGAKQVLAAGLAWLAVKTLVFTYAFAHLSEPTLRNLYIWIRDTRVGEVTRFAEPMYRVFMASQLYLALGIASLQFGFGFVALLFAALAASLSRSFALGLAVGLVIVGLGVMIRAFRVQFVQRLGSGVLFGAVRNVARTAMRVIAGLALGLMMLGAVVYFPVPTPHQGGNITAMFAERYGSGDDAAVSARWALLGPLWKNIQEQPVFGHGFGHTVTYFSPDPYWKALRPDGMVVTTRFEWGWLDVWLKFGLLGGALYLGYVGLLLWQVLLVSLRFGELRAVNAKQDGELAGTWHGRVEDMAPFGVLVTLLAIHATTPYLDHPIGLGVLLALEGLVAIQSRQEEQV